MVNNLLKKIQRSLTQPVKFVVIYDTKKVSYSCLKKIKFLTPRAPILFTNLLVLVATVKTERSLATRLSEHSDPLKSSISKHLSECEHGNFILNLNHIFDNLNDINDSDADTPDTRLSFHNLIQNNTKILHTLKYTNSNLLLFLEALYVKYRKPLLNIGLKASKDLAFFFLGIIVCQ